MKRKVTPNNICSPGKPKKGINLPGGQLSAELGRRYADYNTEFVQNLIDVFPFFAMVIDEDHNIILVNKYALQVLGRGPEELLGCSCPEVVHDGMKSYPGCPLEEAKTTDCSVEKEMLDPVYGKWVTSAIYPLDFASPGGKRIYLHLVQDISERKESENKIFQQVEYMETIMESLTQPFYIIDANEYTIRMANSAAKGESWTDNQKCYELTHQSPVPCDTSKHPCPIAEIKATGKPVTFEHEHYTKHGVKRLFEVHGYPIFDKEGNVYQIIEYTIDITERKRTEEKIRKMQKDLINKSKDLEEKNIALKVLLANLEEEKESINKNILRNIDNLIVPFLEKLQSTSINTTQNTFIDILNLNLSEITKPLSKTLMDEKISLSPIEFQIANLVREGKKAKEIADLMYISVNTVKVHYRNIRTKLGIKNRKINLRSYLQSTLS